MSQWWGLPVLASEHGAHIDRLLIVTHVFIAFLFAGWFAYGVYVLIRFRKSRQPRADHQGARSRATYYIEAVVIGVEVLLLVALSVPFWSRYVVAVPDEAAALQVRLVAQQYAWNFHYSGGDGVFGKTAPEFIDDELNPVGLDRDDPFGKDDIVLRNQLYLPVNRPAVIWMSSQDVIHSLNIPELRVKQDVIPGVQTHVSFEPTMTTEQYQSIKGSADRTFEIACAQLCGLGHYKMRGFLHVLSPESFAKWLEENTPDPNAVETDPFFS